MSFDTSIYRAFKRACDLMSDQLHRVYEMAV